MISNIDMRMFALCCGVVPEMISPHRLDAKCPRCGLEAGVVDGGVPFLICHWNLKVGKKMNAAAENPSKNMFGDAPKLELFGFPGYTFCELEIKFGGWGHTEKVARLHACAFKTPMDLKEHSVSKDGYECIIDENRWLSPMDIVRKGSEKVLHIDWKIKRTSNPISYIYMNNAYSTDNTRWAYLHMNADLVRDHRMIRQWLEKQQ